MKSFTKWVFAAAAIAVVAGSASAQTMKGEVPFAFRAGRGTLQPGSYEIRLGHNGIVNLYNTDARNGAIAMATTAMNPKKEWKDGPPRLVFECAAGDCALLALWSPLTDTALQFPGLKSKSGDARIAMIPLKVLGR